MDDTADELIDTMLRDAFGGPVADDGFAKRVMSDLPAGRRRTSWAVAGGAAAGSVLFAASALELPLGRIGGMVAGSTVPADIPLLAAMAGAALLAAIWAIAEADDAIEAW